VCFPFSPPHALPRRSGNQISDNGVTTLADSLQGLTALKTLNL
jgi:hypothetical protein